MWFPTFPQLPLVRVVRAILISGTGCGEFGQRGFSRLGGDGGWMHTVVSAEGLRAGTCSDSQDLLHKLMKSA
jgi:hypothetical protein